MTSEQRGTVGRDVVVDLNRGNRTVVELPLDTLRLGRTVRLGDVNEDYVTVLAESGCAWSPILVRRADHVIVDGRYRFLAAQRLHCARIRCELFDGDDAAALIESVRRNVAHGLPLTLAERKRAAERILDEHPEWSDRRVAALCALAKGTVGRLRQHEQATTASGAAPVLSSRQGRDGRWRPVDPREVRREVQALLRENPEASLGSIARLSGTTVVTVRSVKQALASKELAKDFAQWFDQTCDTARWSAFVDALPLPKVEEVLEDARRRAADWAEFADALSHRLMEGRPGIALLRAASE